MSCGRHVNSPIRRQSPGFSLLELLFTLAIGLVITAIAVPLVQNVVAYFKLRGAISAVTGAIQSTRYQAIFQGCPYQVVFTAATGTYQVQGEPYSTVTSTCGTVFTNICSGALTACPVPLSGSGTPVTLNADVTLLFRPGGTVTSPQFPGGGITMVLNYGGKPPETITVSNYGSTSVTP